MGGLAALLVSTLFAGCLEDPDEACGSGLVYRYKICAPEDFFDFLEPEEDAGPSLDDAGSDAGGDAAMTAGAVLGEFCNKSSECAPSAPYCAKQPGMDGYCTIIDCDPANPPAVCPANWKCFDVALVAGSGPKACVMP
jgi:hypothetical protein